mmetsp:Transcript_61537/g.169102  ORF Transcript_61537/g.169102 Transcript_61537/m.169102 type:complete len:694 (-) Transcript_61537:218-2299(-)
MTRSRSLSRPSRTDRLSRQGSSEQGGANSAPQEEWHKTLLQPPIWREPVRVPYMASSDVVVIHLNYGEVHITGEQLFAVLREPQLRPRCPTKVSPARASDAGLTDSAGGGGSSAGRKGRVVSEEEVIVADAFTEDDGLSDAEVTDGADDAGAEGADDDGAAVFWSNVRASEQQHKRLRSGDMLRVKIRVTSAEIGEAGSTGERDSASTVTSVLRGHPNQLASFFDLPPHIPVVNPTSIPAAVAVCAVVALTVMMMEVTFIWRCLLSVLLGTAAVIELNGSSTKRAVDRVGESQTHDQGAAHAALLVDMRTAYWLYGRLCALAAMVVKLLQKFGLLTRPLSASGTAAEGASAGSGSSAESGSAMGATEGQAAWALRVFHIQLVDWDWEDGGELGDSALLAAVDSAAEDGQEIGDVLTRVPKRWLDMNNGNVALAEEWWAKTMQWRAATDVESVLSRPQPHFDVIKQGYEHFIAGVDKLGHPIYVDVIKSPNVVFRELKSKGVTVDDVIDHMIYLNEWMWRRWLDDYDGVGTKPDSRAYLLKIVDMQSIGMADTWGDTYDYFQKLSALNKHYPERMYKTFVINVPSSFSFVWRLVAPMLDPNVREKVKIYKANEFKAPLLELVDADQLPERFGGTMKVSDEQPMYLSMPIEKQLRADALGMAAEGGLRGGAEGTSRGGTLSRGVQEEKGGGGPVE